MKINIINGLKTIVRKHKFDRQEKQIQKYFKINEAAKYTDAGQQIYKARHVIANYAKANDMFVEVRPWSNPELHYSKDLRKLEISIGKFRDPLHNNYLYSSKIDTNVNKTYPTQLNEKSFTEDNFLRRVYRIIETLKSRCNEPHKEEVRVFDNVEEAQKFIQSLANKNGTHNHIIKSGK